VYLPATHSEHVPPSRPVAPALQAHAVETLLPGGASESVGHVWHAASPAAILYFPATHSEHTPPSGPVDPALQAHVALPPDESEFVGHAAHGPPSGPLEPALQVQLVKTGLPTEELEFTGHVKHIEL